jgi:hypothetical protein
MSKTLRFCLATLLHLLLVTNVSAQEYFGNFLDKLKGEFIPDAKPRPLFKLESEFRFKDPNGLLWLTPGGTSVDGASIPQALWSFIGGPFEGPYIGASVIHDYYCKTKERTAHDTHRNFYYGMRAAQVPEWRAKLMHWAVETFGPSWKLDKRVVLKQTCTGMPGQQAVCSSVPTVEVKMVSIPPVDLSDPTVLAVAVAKTNAVARTLLTTKGTVLDVTAAGTVAATPENIAASSVAYRQVFASQDFSSSTSRLGLLSQSAGGTLDQVEPWAGGRVPKLREAVVLTDRNISKVEEYAPYKLDPRSKELIRDRIDLKNLEATSRVPSQVQ